MRICRHLGLLLLSLVVSCIVVGLAEAAELKVLSAVGMQAVLEELRPRFERQTGHRLAMSFAPLGILVKRVQGGEGADVIVLPRQGVDELVMHGKVVPQSVALVARSGVGIAVRQGAPKPDISSAETLKRTLLAARTVTYSNPARGGASGVHVAKVLERLGIADEMRPKTIFKQGSVGALVAAGEAEIAIHQLQLLAEVPGIDIVGPLPAEFQDTIVFAAAVMHGTGNAEASKALVEFLLTPDAARVIGRKGMDPARP